MLLHKETQTKCFLFLLNGSIRISLSPSQVDQELFIIDPVLQYKETQTKCILYLLDGSSRFSLFFLELPLFNPVLLP